MWELFLIVLFLIIWASIPIILWGYLFSYFDERILNRKKFGLWIFAGIISVFPVLFLKEYSTDLEKIWWNVFSYLPDLSFWVEFLWFFLSLVALVFLISFLPFLVHLKNHIKERGIIFLKNFFIFSWYVGILAVGFLLLQYIFGYFSDWDFGVDTNISFGEVVFNSLKLVIFYYVILALVEELSKFFCFKYSSFFSLTNLREWVLFSIFVALWFAFLENILYFYSVYQSQGLSSGLIGVYLSRNIFSVILHVLCSSVFAYFFTQAYLKFREYNNIFFLKKVFQWFFIAILLHAIFNIFLTLDVMIFVFLYLIWAYFYMTYIFYEDESEWS